MSKGGIASGGNGVLEESKLGWRIFKNVRNANKARNHDVSLLFALLYPAVALCGIALCGVSKQNAWLYAEPFALQPTMYYRRKPEASVLPFSERRLGLAVFLLTSCIGQRSSK
eukprot:scaffold268852_cov17-Tisochrysis_lutea.AAC.1